MSSSYTGNATGITSGQSPTITCPADADSRNAASVNTPLQKLADFLRRIMDNAGFLDLARVWSARQTFGAGLDASGATSAISNGLTVNGGLTSTGTLSVTGTGGVSLTAGDCVVPAGKDYKFAAVKTFARMVTAYDFKGIGITIGPTNTSPIPSQSFISLGLNNVAARIEVPVGANIILVEILARQTSGSDKNFEISVSKMNATSGVHTSFSTLAIATVSSSAAASWHSASPSSAISVASDEFVAINIGGGHATCDVYLARVWYELTTVNPMG